MTRDVLELPSARTWRDIPQPVVPRAMSREGRWRFTMATLRTATVVTVCGVIGWGVWLVAASLNENPKTMPAIAKTTPMKAPEIQTDGVLDKAWLARTLALPPRVSLMELDLDQLRARLLGDRQVVNATLTRRFPDRLVVQVTERVPVARVKIAWLDQQQELLVARDGVVFDGKGYDRGLLDSLPWLDGIELRPQGGGFKPIAGMAVAAELLAKARLEAENLYATWDVISLAHLDSDHQIEIRTRNGPCLIYFSTRDDFFRQLAKLNYIWDQLLKVPNAKAKIDLSLGRDVPVMVEAPANPADPATGRGGPRPAERRPATEMPPSFTPATTANAQRALFVFPPPQPNRNQREL